MNIDDVDNALKAADEAKTKAQLQDAVTPFGIDLDLRKTMGALKDGITAALQDVRGDLLAEQSPPAPGDSVADTPVADAPAPVIPEPQASLPPLGADPEPQTQPGHRILVHKVTGRRFVWTPILAQLRDLEEE